MSRGASRSSPRWRVNAALQRTEWRLEGWRDLDVLGVTGCALGVDWDAAGEWRRMGISYLALVPFPGQERRWPAASRETYAKVLAAAVGVLAVTPDPPLDSEAAVTALHARNDRLCTVADELIAVWDGSRGGTGSCVRNWRYVGNELRAHIDPDREREALGGKKC